MVKDRDLFVGRNRHTVALCIVMFLVVLISLNSSALGDNLPMPSATETPVAKGQLPLADSGKTIDAGADATVTAAMVGAAFGVVSTIISFFVARGAAKVPLVHEETRKRMDIIQKLKSDLLSIRQSLDEGTVFIRYLEDRDSPDATSKFVRSVTDWAPAQTRAQTLIHSNRVYVDPDLVAEYVGLNEKHTPRVVQDVLSQMTESLKNPTGQFEIKMEKDQILRHLEDCFNIPKLIEGIDSLLDKQIERLAKKLGWY